MEAPTRVLDRRFGAFAKAGKRTVEPVEQEGPNRAPVPARANHERYPLGVGT